MFRCYFLLVVSECGGKNFHFVHPSAHLDSVATGIDRFIDYLPYPPLLRHGSIRVGVLWSEVLRVLTHVRPRLNLAPIEGEDRGHS